MGGEWNDVFCFFLARGFIYTVGLLSQTMHRFSECMAAHNYRRCLRLLLFNKHAQREQMIIVPLSCIEASRILATCCVCFSVRARKV